MADEREEDAPEGWHVPQRPVMIAAVLVPLTLLVLLLAAGAWYDRSVRPQRIAPVHSFPAPGIEAFAHDGLMDRGRRTRPGPVDASIARAEAEVAASGLPGWDKRR